VLIERGDAVLAAVSGGSDSVALLHFLLSLREEGGFSVACAHVEHGIRGGESARDAAFVQKLCAEYGIELFLHRADAPAFAREKRLNLEQAAREIRYGFLNGLLAEGRFTKLATAHNRGDNTETILLHYLRGSGMRGLSGMKAAEFPLIRPLLYTPKREILQYVEDNGLAFVTDGTNADTAYSRNFLRKEILPRLEAKFPAYEKNILNAAALLREEDDFLNALAEKHVSFESADTGFVSLPAGDVILRRAALLCLKKIGVCQNIESVHLKAVASLAEGRTGAGLTLPYARVVKEYGRLCFYREKAVPPPWLPFAGAGEYRLGEAVIRVETVSVPAYGDGALYASKAAVPENCVFRTRREGDSFKRFAGGKKLLSDFFTDEKVPLRRRDGVLLLADGGEILAVFGKDIADRVRVKDGDTEIYRFTLENG
jgi:tRNA(Ile)-lysidine synthase